MEAVKYLVVHCSATPPNMAVDAKMIDRWHRQQGWRCIGYHYVIKRDGEVQKGRPENEAGAHAIQVNDCSIGICLVGGVAADKVTPEDNFTGAQYKALRRLLLELLGKYPKAMIIGHRDVEKRKACPSFDVKSWWRDGK